MLEDFYNHELIPISLTDYENAIKSGPPPLFYVGFPNYAKTDGFIFKDR